VNTPGLRLTASDIWSRRWPWRRPTRATASPKVRFVQADWLSPFAPGLDLVCANHPTFPARGDRLEVARHEPRIALDGGVDGLDPTRRLLALAQRRLNPGGCLLLEIEESHGPAVRALAQQSYARATVALLKDLAGRDRLLRIDRE
jgi:release factor glutamine methyltransferase